MLKLEGHFTAEEIKAAMALGATASPLAYGKQRLHFRDQSQYEEWLRRQVRRSPPNSLVSLPRKRAARPGPAPQAGA